MKNRILMQQLQVPALQIWCQRCLFTRNCDSHFRSCRHAGHATHTSEAIDNCGSPPPPLGTGVSLGLGLVSCLVLMGMSRRMSVQRVSRGPAQSLARSAPRMLQLLQLLHLISAMPMRLCLLCCNCCNVHL